VCVCSVPATEAVISVNSDQMTSLLSCSSDPRLLSPAALQQPSPNFPAPAWWWVSGNITTFTFAFQSHPWHGV